MTLYLKYRPQTIDDLDLKAVRETLKNTLSKDEIPHAFLFAGPKGTGKTSAARILAKALNCDPTTLALRGVDGIEPCNQCATCISITRGENLDVIEIDAASHRGIDDIRSLREAVKLAPMGARKKVYIIDEAHMLTTEACNALLKILEEPPSHVVFILATTNPEKLIDTIRSRTTLVAFTKAKEEDVVRRLEKVALGEKIDMGSESDAILKLIARGADGAFRDGVKLFEQLISSEVELTKDSVSEFLFGSKSFEAQAFLQKVRQKDTKSALTLIEHAVSAGISAKTMAKVVLENLRDELIKGVGTGSKTEETLELVQIFSKAYTEIPTAYLEQLPLEIAVVKWCENSAKVKEKSEKLGEQIPKEVEIKVKSAPAENVKVKEKSEKFETEKKGMDTVVTNVQVFSDEMWTKVLLEVRLKNASTEALLRACKPLLFDGKILTVGVFYKFHKERLESHPHRDLLEEALQSLLGNPIRITCTLTEPPLRKVQEEISQNNEVVLTEAREDDSILKVAKEIFGS